MHRFDFLLFTTHLTSTTPFCYNTYRHLFSLHAWPMIHAVHGFERAAPFQDFIVSKQQNVTIFPNQ